LEEQQQYKPEAIFKEAALASGNINAKFSGAHGSSKIDSRAYSRPQVRLV